MNKYIKNAIVSAAAITVVIGFSNSVRAQVNKASTTKTQINQTISSTSTTTIDKDGNKTKNGDELCILSNGNKIPCIWVVEAEQEIQDIKTYGDIRPTIDGKKYCRPKSTNFFYRNFAYTQAFFECSYLNDDGTLALSAYKDFLNIKKIIFTVLGLVILVILVITIIRKKRKSIKYVALFLIITSIAFYEKTSYVNADIPALPTNTFACGCVTNNTMTCLSNNSDMGGVLYIDSPSSYGPLPEKVRISCRGDSNTYNVLQRAGTGNTDYAQVTRINVLANRVLLQNLSYSLTPATQLLSSYYPNEQVAYRVPANAGLMGYDSGVTCYKQNGSGTLHITGQFCFQNPGGGKGNGTGGCFIGQNFSCY